MPIDMRTAPYAALLLRVTLGIYAIAHIYWKFYIRPDGFDGWWNGLSWQGTRTGSSLYVLSGEFLGALLLIPGIFTRWVALYALPLIVGAAQFWLVRKGFFFTGAGAELPILWAVALLVQAGLGDGAYALVALAALPVHRPPRPGDARRIGEQGFCFNAPHVPLNERDVRRSRSAHRPTTARRRTERARKSDAAPRAAARPCSRP